MTPENAPGLTAGLHCNTGGLGCRRCSVARLPRLECRCCVTLLCCVTGELGAPRKSRCRWGGGGGPAGQTAARTEAQSGRAGAPRVSLAGPLSRPGALLPPCLAGWLAEGWPGCGPRAAAWLFALALHPFSCGSECHLPWQRRERRGRATWVSLIKNVRIDHTPPWRNQQHGLSPPSLWPGSCGSHVLGEFRGSRRGEQQSGFLVSAEHSPSGLGRASGTGLRPSGDGGAGSRAQSPRPGQGAALGRVSGVRDGVGRPARLLRTSLDCGRPRRDL